MACLLVSYASLNGENVTPTLLLSPRVERCHSGCNIGTMLILKSEYAIRAER